MLDQMSPRERDRLVGHLDDQAQTLAEMTRAAREHPHNPEALLRIRDQLFVMRETLDTLRVPHATATHDDWRRAIGAESP
jgi:plasmid stabilization system protein ParE